VSTCKNCGEQIKRARTGRPREFCDNDGACRQAYHRAKRGGPPVYQDPARDYQEPRWTWPRTDGRPKGPGGRALRVVRKRDRDK
jgi:hypothetical protein